MAKKRHRIKCAEYSTLNGVAGCWLLLLQFSMLDVLIPDLLESWNSGRAHGTVIYFVNRRAKKKRKDMARESTGKKNLLILFTEPTSIYLSPPESEWLLCAFNNIPKRWRSAEHWCQRNWSDDTRDVLIQFINIFSGHLFHSSVGVFYLQILSRLVCPAALQMRIMAQIK